MSSPTFDPNKFRVEDLFRAKEERRQRLARLPFEEKIKIVKRLQTGVSAAMKNEKLIFDSFLKAYPDLASEIEEWDVVEDWYANRALDPPPQPFDKRPDIIARTASGKTIGVELKSWVNREQITEARKQERIQGNILKAIGEQPRNTSQHIGQVWLSAKQVRFNARDASDFKKQMFEFIAKGEDSWLHGHQGDQKSWQDLRDFTGFPCLEKYLGSVCLHSVRRRRVNNWILFPNPYPGGHYSPKDMRETLRSALLAHRSDERYKDLRAQAELGEVYLLVHYDFKAFVYNTPFDAPDFGFKEAADFASSVLDGDGGYFDRVFLFHFLWGKEEAYRIV